MRRTSTAAALLLALVVAAAPAGAVLKPASVPASAPRPPVVAVIDTGVHATHQEFDYRGRLSGTDQFVAWWDFTREVKAQIELPHRGEFWDSAVPEPYDRHGHGTLTASMVGGRGVDVRKTPAALPGAKLAIAKVGNGDGTIQGDIGAAVRWATDTVKADVISISIGSIVPFPAALARANYNAIKAARQAGILVVVANGNGYGGAGLVPGDPGWASLYSSSPSVLAVGAAGANGLLVSTDPEVAAIYSVFGPAHTADKAYRSNSGTSFGAPFVAGFAASLIKTAREAGRALGVEQLEKLIKYSASDTSIPATFEGYGVVDMAGLAGAQSHARAGTLPTRPVPDLTGMYVETYAGTLRSAWSD